jgi:hypothetical protein
MHPLLDNPFFVLDVGVDATPLEIERQGRKLLGMVELGLAAATTYATPLGPRPRTAEALRAAMQALLDPARRLAFEPWAAAPRTLDPAAASAGAPQGASPSGARPRAAASLVFADIAAGGLAWWQR